MSDPLKWNMTLPNGQPLRWDMGPEYTWDGVIPASAYPRKAMQQNDISQTVTAAQEAAIMTKIDELNALIAAWAMTITDAQRQSYFKLSDRRLAFHEKCRDYMHQHPETVPPTIDMTEYDKDQNLFDATSRIIAKINTVLQPVVDTQTVAGADLLNADLFYYNYLPLEAKAGVPGAEDIHGDLKESYPGRGPGTPKAPAKPNP